MAATIIKGTAHVIGSSRSFSLFNGKEVTSVKQDGKVLYRLQGLDRLVELEAGTVVKTYDGFKESVVRLMDDGKWAAVPEKFDPGSHSDSVEIPMGFLVGDLFVGHSINGDKVSHFNGATVVGAAAHHTRDGELSSVSVRVTVERDGAQVERSIVPERFTGTVTRAGNVIGRFFLGAWEPAPVVSKRTSQRRARKERLEGK